MKERSISVAVMTFTPTTPSGSIRSELQEGFTSARKLTKAQALERACGVGQRKRSFPITMKVKAAEEVSMGKPVKQVARALNVAPKRVREWSQMFQKGCFDAVQKDPTFVMRERKRVSGAGRQIDNFFSSLCGGSAPFDHNIAES